MQTDYNHIYSILEDKIKLAKSFTGFKELPFLFRACRLKPINFTEGELSSKLDMVYDWIDEWGNIVTLKNKITTHSSYEKLVISFNPIYFNRNSIYCTDLYHGLSLDKITKISKNILVLNDKNDYYQYLAITFLGLDNYFRTFIYCDGMWLRATPLIMGFKILNKLIENIDVNNNFQLDTEEINKFNTPIKINILNGWISGLYPDNEFIIKMINIMPSINFDFLKPDIR